MIASKNILTILSALTFAGCVTSGPLRPDPLAEPLEKAGWTFVDVPRQVLGPGTIVSIRDTDGIRYRGNIEDCVPSEAINIRRELAVGIAGVFEGGRTISAAAFLGFHDIKVGGEYSNVGSVKVEVGQITEEVLNEIVFKKWLDDHANMLSETCLGYMRGHGGSDKREIAGRIYILTDVLKVTGYRYTFNDKKGGKINLAPPGALSKYLSFNGNVNISADKSGSLEVKEPLYIAFKKAFWTGTSGPIGASPGQDTGSDVMMRRLRIVEQ